MTNDEAKSVLFDMLGKGIYVKDTKENRAILVALRALDNETLNNEWIPVSEKLPEHDDTILVTVNMGPSGAVGIDEYSIFEEHGFIGFGKAVEAWKPLPKPYSYEESEGI